MTGFDAAFFQIEQTVQESAAQRGVNRKSTGLQGRDDTPWATAIKNVKKPPGEKG